MKDENNFFGYILLIIAFLFVIAILFFYYPGFYHKEIELNYYKTQMINFCEMTNLQYELNLVLQDMITQKEFKDFIEENPIPYNLKNCSDYLLK